ncbi:hypothetical protein PROFUN_04337 [Planoprotostelium fungivorum]|uniref:Uncharacterized protein n=1 Tax=Planoprotostelium fungivorum TaxID=1890364 RepID=A0A2P6NV80_9EUKA|nr:hypothetical protein PROFUN_04337 [Planoprotostelium fungivorum]
MGPFQEVWEDQIYANSESQIAYHPCVPAPEVPSEGGPPPPPPPAVKKKPPTEGTTTPKKAPPPAAGMQMSELTQRIVDWNSPISTTVKTEEWNSFFAFLRLQDLFKRMINEMAVSVCPIHIWSEYMDSYRKDYALRTKAASECKMDSLNLDTFPAEVIDHICAFLALRSIVIPAHRRFRLKHLNSSSRDKSALSYINRNPEDTTHLTIKSVVKPSLTSTFSRHDLFPNLEALVFHATSQADHLFIEQLRCRHLKDLKLSQSSYLPVVTFPHLRKFSLSGNRTGFPNLFLEKNESISCFSMDDTFRPREDVLSNLTEANISAVTWDWLVAPMMTRGGLQRPPKRVTLCSKYHGPTYQ